jgi:hypothetical protein
MPMRIQTQYNIWLFYWLEKLPKVTKQRPKILNNKQKSHINEKHLLLLTDAFANDELNV